MEANGLQLAGRSLDHMTDHASLLKKLRRHRDAWLDLDIQSCFKQDCGDEDMTLWGLRDGVFAKAYPQNASAVSGPKAAMAFFALDKAGENRAQIDLDVTFTEFTTDLSQDLVILAGLDPDRKSRGWLRLRSSTTGRAHSQAEYSLLTFELGFSVDTGISSTPVTLGIKNKLVAAKFASPGQRVYEILIWNWKTGELLHRISCNTGICSFGFLDDDRLVIWSASSSNVENGLAVVSLLVYEQIGSGTGLGRDASHCEPLNVTSFPVLKPSFTFLFPELLTPSYVSHRGFLLQSDYGSGSGELPDEMVVQIMLCCVFRDVLSFSALHIELEANGLQIAQDLPSNAWDHLSLMNKLRRYRDAWLDVELKLPVQLAYGGENMPLWELRDGIFAKAYANRDTQPLIPGPNSLRLFSLDHIDIDTRVDLGISFHEFNIDPSQDLVVLVGVEYSNREPHGWIQFRASTTGQAHPQAAHSVIAVKLGFETEDATIHNQVELKQDLVAVLFACFAPPARPYEVLIWNWKRGILLNRIGCNNGICSFVFLDADRLALWCARGEHGSEVLDSLDLLVYDKIGSSNPGYDVPDPEKWHIPSSPILSPALTLQFPKLQEASRVKPGGFILLSDYGSG
ncbi:hypothetical protein FRC09_003327, partial [Ceratobasidium sp. 395]